MSKLLHQPQYESAADSLLDSFYGKAYDILPKGIEYGVAGLGFGLMYLIKKHLAEGDINDVLEEIDIQIFRPLTFLKDQTLSDSFRKAELLYYCSVRYGDQMQGEVNEMIFKRLIFSILNSCVSIPDDLTKEPVSFSLSFRLPFFLYSLGATAAHEPFRYKVKKIAEGITGKVVSLLPVLHSHRLYLLWGMIRLTQIFRLPAWEEHIHLLRSGMDMNRIIDGEIADDNIFFQNGLTGIGCLLQDYNNRVNDAEKIQYDPFALCDRIGASQAWRKLQYDGKFLIDNMGLSGFCGTALFLLTNENK
jgi:hypothetical protein